MRWLLLFNHFVIWYFALSGAFYALLMAASLWKTARYRWQLKNLALPWFADSPLTPPVSILVPAYNEEASITEAVRSFLGLQYPELEVVVVNDGSTDGTLEELRKMFGLVSTHLVNRPEIPCAPVRGLYISPQEPRLLVVDKANGGKADALNAGLNFARSPYFCAVDADALLEPDALIRVMAPVLRNRTQVLATGGIVRVANGCRIREGKVLEVRLPRRAVEILQVVEYLRGFLFGRLGWSALNSLLIISGAFGVFLRSLALEIGGYRRDTVGEDMDLVVRMHRRLCDSGRDYRIVFVPDPVCWTQAPADLRTLARQRRRWQKGLLDVLWRNRGMILNPRYGRVGTIGLVYQTVVELLGPLMELAGLSSILAAAWLGALDWRRSLFYLLMGYLAGTVISVAGVLLEELIYRRYASLREVMKLLAFAFLEFFPYRQFLMVSNVAGMVEYVWNRRAWGTQRRLGFSPPAKTPEHQEA